MQKSSDRCVLWVELRLRLNVVLFLTTHKSRGKNEFLSGEQRVNESQRRVGRN